MPRGKANKPSFTVQNTEAGGIKLEYEDSKVKIKIESESADQLSPQKPDLSKYKFMKKSPIKIEYENCSPESKGLWEPPSWKEFLLNLRTMRSNNDAPVDTMGCHKSMDEEASPEVYRYQCLISLMLSSQTKDQVTFAAMERLRARGLTVDGVLAMTDEELGQLIYPVGFWKTKVKYIKKTTQTLKDQYNSDIPDSVEKLCKLTGVGPKMAHICMKVAWDKVTGIGVDTHVHRISNRIGWVKNPTSTPEETRKSLQSWLPFELWSDVNHLMVGFGQTICLPIGPTCHECLNSHICPSSGKVGKSPKKLDVKSEVESKSPKKKITPKKEKVKAENDSLTESLNSVEENTLPMRKITPKRKSKEIEQNDGDDFHLKTEEAVIKPKLPRQTKVTPNKKTIREVDEINTDNTNLAAQPTKAVRTRQQKTSPVPDNNLNTKTEKRQRKITPTKTNVHLLLTNDSEDLKINIEKKTRSSKNQNLEVPNEEQCRDTKKSPIRRKSPKEKAIGLNEETGKKKRITKK